MVISRFENEQICKRLYEENNYIQINEKYCHTFGYGNAFFV